MVGSSAPSLASTLESSSLAVMQVGLLLTAGAMLARRGVLHQAACASYSRVVFTLFYPALLLINVGKAITPQEVLDWWPLPVVCLLVCGIGFVIGQAVVLVTRKIRRAKRNRGERIPRRFWRGVVAACSLRTSAYVPIILVNSLFGPLGSVHVSDAEKHGCGGERTDPQDCAIAYIGFYVIFIVVVNWAGMYTYMAGDTYGEGPDVDDDEEEGDSTERPSIAGGGKSRGSTALLTADHLAAHHSDLEKQQQSRSKRSRGSRTSRRISSGRDNDNNNNDDLGNDDGANFGASYGSMALSERDLSRAVVAAGRKDSVNDDDDGDFDQGNSSEDEDLMVRAAGGLMRRISVPAGPPSVAGMSVSFSAANLAPSTTTWRETLRRILNPPVIAVLVALVIGLVRPVQKEVFGSSPFFQALVNVLQLLGRCAAPSAIVLTGASLGRGGLPPRSAAISGVHIACVVMCNLVVTPLIVGGLIYAADSGGLLASQNALFKFVMYVETATPTNSNLVIICQLLKGGAKKARAIAVLCFWQYIASVVTLTGAISVYLYLLFQGK